MFGLLDLLDVRNGLRIGLAAGVAGASICLAACWIVTETGPLTPGSLAVELSPWWANWKVALGGFASAGLLFGVGAATRPPKRKG